MSAFVVFIPPFLCLINADRAAPEKELSLSIIILDTTHFPEYTVKRVLRPDASPRCIMPRRSDEVPETVWMQYGIFEKHRAAIYESPASNPQLFPMPVTGRWRFRCHRNRVQNRILAGIDHEIVPESADVAAQFHIYLRTPTKPALVGANPGTVRLDHRTLVTAPMLCC